MRNTLEINRALAKLTDVRALMDISAEFAEGYSKSSMACLNLHRAIEVCADMLTEAIEAIEANVEGL